MKKIRIQGSPGTGKTRRLVKLYYDNIQTNSATEIIMTSHTNTAADEIRDRIKDKDNILKYENETEKSIYHLIKESTETLKETVTTIHKYCCLKIKKIKGQSVVFNGEDYGILKQHFTLFNTHAGSKKLHTLDMLIANHPFFRFHSTARDNGLDTVQYYRTLSFE